MMAILDRLLHHGEVFYLGGDIACEEKNHSAACESRRFPLRREGLIRLSQDQADEQIFGSGVLLMIFIRTKYTDFKPQSCLLDKRNYTHLREKSGIVVRPLKAYHKVTCYLSHKKRCLQS